MPTRWKAVIGSVVLVLSVVAGTAGGAVGSGAGVAVESTDNTTAQPVLEYAENTAGSSGPPFTEDIKATVVENSFEFGNGSAIRVRNVRTGESVTLTPAAEQSPVTVTGDVEIAPSEYGAAPYVYMENATVQNIDVEVNITGDTDMFSESTFAPLKVELVGASGDVVAETDVAIHGIARPKLTATYNGSAIAVERKSDVNASWSVVLNLFGSGGSVEMSNGAGDDYFVGQYNGSDDDFGLRIYPTDERVLGDRIAYHIFLDVERVNGSVGNTSDGSSGNGSQTGTVVRLAPTTASVGTNGTVTYDVVVENVDAGIGSIGFDVGVNDTSVGTVENVSVNDGFPSSFTTTELASNGSMVSVQVAGGDTADTGPVTVGTVTLRGQQSGAVAVDLSVDSVGDEDGFSYEVADSEDATLTVTDQPDVVVLGSNPTNDGPGEYAGDGVHQDVNGDGSVTLSDVTALFTNYNGNAVQTNGDRFDYNGDGSISLADVTTLFNQVAA